MGMLFDKSQFELSGWSPDDVEQAAWHEPNAVIYADPPWSYSFSKSKNRSIEAHYETMTLRDLADLNMPSFDNVALFMWATAPKLPEAIWVMEQWRFCYKSCLAWDKQKLGMGYWFRGQHELLLVGTKGTVSPPKQSDRVSSLLSSPRGIHSKKPDVVREWIEDWYPNAKRFEFFAREAWPGWSTLGNETQQLLWSNQKSPSN